MRGRFIVLEGCDGAGTTTQTAKLVAALLARGIPAVGTREPTNGPVGVLIRQMLTGRVVNHAGASPSWKVLAGLFATDRLDHLENEIDPLLDEGTWVVSDRYLLSSVVYQGLAQGDAAMAWVRQLNAEARLPDLTIILDVPGSVANARRRTRGGRPELFEVDDLQVRMAALYTGITSADGYGPVAHADGTADPAAVHAAVLALALDRPDAPA